MMEMLSDCLKKFLSQNFRGVIGRERFGAGAGSNRQAL